MGNWVYTECRFQLSTGIGFFCLFFGLNITFLCVPVFPELAIACLNFWLFLSVFILQLLSFSGLNFFLMLFYYLFTSVNNDILRWFFRLNFMPDPLLDMVLGLLMLMSYPVDIFLFSLLWWDGDAQTPLKQHRGVYRGVYELTMLMRVSDFSIINYE